MEVNITGRHFEITEPIKEHVMEKLKRLNRHADNIIDVHVILSIENSRHLAEVVVLLGDTTFLSKEATADMYLSVDKTVSKIKHQLDTHRDKVISRHKKHRKEEPLL